MNNPVNVPTIRIESRGTWNLADLREILHYRDLLFFMILRGIKASYAQSIGGYAWAVIQPALQIVVFTVIFGKLLGLEEGMTTPYALLTTIAVIPWGYMQGAITAVSNSLVFNAGMLAKVYFPRVVFLLTPVLGGLINFSVAIFLLIGVLLYYKVQITANLLYLPLYLVLMVLGPLAFGLWLSSLAIRYRDVKIAMASMLRMLIYLVPVMYPSESIPERWRDIYILNPFVGIIEGFQSCLLGLPFRWDSTMYSCVIILIVFVTGAIYFKRMERVIVDVI